MIKFSKCSSIVLACALVLSSLTGCTKAADKQVATMSEASKVVLTDEAQLKAVADVRQKLTYMYENGANLRLVMSDDESDDWYLMYNKNKECYAEMTGGGAVIYQPNGDRTVFTSSVVQGRDLDPLAIINNMIILAEEGVATIEVSKVDSLTGTTVNNEAGDMGKEVESLVANTEETEETEDEVTESSKVATGSEVTGSEVAESEVAESEVTDGIEVTESISEVTETEVGEATEPSSEAEETEIEAEETEIEAEETEIEAEETKAEEKGVELNQYVITVKGLNDIKKIYSKTLSDDETDTVVESILTDNLTNKDSDKTNYLYTLTVNTKDDNAISARLTLTMDDIEYIGWWFDGYIDIGDWSLPEGWNGSHTEEEWVDLYNKLKDNIQAAIDKYAKNNFTEEQINEMMKSETIEETSPDLAETTEAVDETNESIEAAEPNGYVASINRDESFNDKVQALLKEDGLSEDNIESFEIPEGYTKEDKDKMVELYNTIKEWDKDQANGVLVSPIGMSDIEFISEYLDACKEGYSKDVKSSEVDKYGTIFWEDTLGTFIRMLQ